jgi:hypothetical protein
VGNGVFILELGPKFWYDIQLASDLGLYLSPQGLLGLGVGTEGVGAFFTMQFGFALKLILNDKVALSFKPFGFDIGIADNVGVRYDLMFSAGITF